MASLTERPSGKNMAWYIVFHNERNERKTISLSQRKYNKKYAEQLKEVVEALVYNRANQIPVPNKRIEKWILEASPEIQKKLASVGLIEQLETYTCEELWEAFLEQKEGTVKASTMKTYYTAKERFFSHFKKDEYIGYLTPARFEELRTKLRETLGDTTIAGTFKEIIAVFNWAEGKKMLHANPLNGVSRGSFVNSKNDRFVPREVYLKLLEHCPCLEWRVIVALARYGGMRPCEILILRWDDINWKDGCIHVRIPKTEHHEGKEKRVPPIFPEVKEELSKLFFRDENKGHKFVIHRYGGGETNIGTEFDRITSKAGFQKIPRPFDNMRMTRSNEVRERFGEYCESMWIGHSRQTARKHYYKVLPKEIKEATTWVTEPDDPTPNAPDRPERPNRPQEKEPEPEKSDSSPSEKIETFDDE